MMNKLSDLCVKGRREGVKGLGGRGESKRERGEGCPPGGQTVKI